MPRPCAVLPRGECPAWPPQLNPFACRHATRWPSASCFRFDGVTPYRSRTGTVFSVGTASRQAPSSSLTPSPSTTTRPTSPTRTSLTRWRALTAPAPRTVRRSACACSTALAWAPASAWAPTTPTPSSLRCCKPSCRRWTCTSRCLQPRRPWSRCPSLLGSSRRLVPRAVAWRSLRPLWIFHA